MKRPKKRKKVAQKANRSPKVITKYRYRTKQKARKKGGGRRKKPSSAGKVAAAVGTVMGAAVVGGMANEAGLLYRLPVQNKTGISLVGWSGGILILGGLIFARREWSKLLTYGVGGGLATTEVVRQIDNRFYDFEVAFNGAPAITSDPTPPQLDAAAVRNSIKIENP